MLESLAKRLLFFGRLIIVTSLISLVACLQKFDAIDFREDVVNLSLLVNLQSIPSLEEIRRPSRSAHDRALDWFDKAHPEEAKRLSQAREKVTDWLKKSGTSESALSQLSGKPGAVGRSDQETTPFYFMEIVGINERLEAEGQQKRGQKVDRPERLRTVAELLDALDTLATPTSLASVVQINGPLPPIEHNYDLKSVHLRGQSLEVLMDEEIQPFVQREAMSDTISLPVTISRVDNAPSLLYLNEPNRPINGALEALVIADQRKATLRRLYGLLPIEEAKSIASKGLTDAYQSVSIFGFSFSTRRFPFAVLACLTLAIAGTLATIGTANRASLRILTDFSDPDVMDWLMDRRVGRVLLWAVLPPLAVVASLPLVPIGAYQRSVLILAAVALAAAGLFCVQQSRRV